jgi:4-hydroxythreonine-4-phosphate dehydrogenase
VSTHGPEPDRRTIAVTLGDPRGIGPEVAFEALRTLRTEDPALSTIVVAPEGFCAAHPHACVDELHEVEAWDGTDTGAGRAAALSIEAAVDLALNGSVGAIVTAPIHKPSLHEAGWMVPGHTEMLQQLVGAATVGMLMCAEKTLLGGPLRVLLATTHLSLRDVPDAVTADLLYDQAALLDAALRSDWGLPAPRLAICALNPHASDQGLFGDEEARVFAPAVARLRGQAIDVEGPLPADTVFRRALDGAFDAVVAPYHDVGMAAFKTAAFGTGVNVTLGLPFVRTSPDHGTAFDLASDYGQADASSMLEALRLADRLMASRFSAGRPGADQA